MGLWRGLLKTLSPILLGKLYVQMYGSRFIENCSLLPRPSDFHLIQWDEMQKRVCSKNIITDADSSFEFAISRLLFSALLADLWRPLIFGYENLFLVLKTFYNLLSFHHHQRDIGIGHIIILTMSKKTLKFNLTLFNPCKKYFLQGLFSLLFKL